MRQVELHRYWVTPGAQEAPYLTEFVMDRETAEREYPGAVAETSSRVVCEEPETEEECVEWIARYHSAGHYTFEPPADSVPVTGTPANPSRSRSLAE